MSVLPQLYEYIQDPPAHAYTFALCNYQPQPGELAFCLDFLCSSKKLRGELQKLVLFNCLAGDEDCVALAHCLPGLTALGCLSLKQNNITSAGVGHLMQVPREPSHSPPLFCSALFCSALLCSALLCSG